MRSLIDDIEGLLALGKGDKYRLTDMRARIEKNKRLYISDREFLEKLVKTYLGRSGLSPDPDSRLTKSLPTPESESGLASSAPKPAQKFENYEKDYLDKLEKDSKAEGFSINLDGEVGEKTTRDVAKRKTEPEQVTKQETKSDVCTNCSSKMTPDEIFCINCGAKRAEADSTLYEPKPIPQPTPKP